MAKTKTTKSPAKSKEAKESKEVAVSSGFADKVSKAKDVDKAVRAEDSLNVTFISVCQSTARALDDEDQEFHIKGLKVKDFYIQSKKLKLGNKLSVVPLSFITVYNEFSGSGNDAKFLGVWHKEDALKFPLSPTHFFNREMPNGNELRPVKWVVVYLPDFPELTNVVMTFKSTANRVAKAWAKDIEANGGMSSQLLYVLHAKTVSNDKGKWFEVVPEFVEKVFEEENGKIKVLKGYAEEVVNLSLEYNEAYTKGTLIPKRSESLIKSLMDNTKSDNEEDDEDDDEMIPF